MSSPYRKYNLYKSEPLNSMAISPSFPEKPGQNPDSFFMGEDEEYGQDWEEDEDEEYGQGVTPNGKMAYSQLRSLEENIGLLMNIIEPNMYLEPWVAAKLSEVEQSISEVSDYLRFNEED